MGKVGKAYSPSAVGYYGETSPHCRSQVSQNLILKDFWGFRKAFVSMVCLYDRTKIQSVKQSPSKYSSVNDIAVHLTDEISH